MIFKYKDFLEEDAVNTITLVFLQQNSFQCLRLIRSTVSRRYRGVTNRYPKYGLFSRDSLACIYLVFRTCLINDALITLKKFTAMQEIMILKTKPCWDNHT